jgi:hypothetical protein
VNHEAEGPVSQADTQLAAPIPTAHPFEFRPDCGDNTNIDFTAHRHQAALSDDSNPPEAPLSVSFVG